MRRNLLLLLVLLLALTGCAAPEEGAPTAAEETPLPTALLAEASTPDPWAVYDGTRLFYVDNDGLRRREGGEETVVDAGESRQYVALYKLESGDLLLLKRLAHEEERARMEGLPSWMFGYDADPAILQVLLLDERGENARLLIDGAIDPLFVRQDTLVCLAADAERALLVADLPSGEVRKAQGVDLRDQVVTETRASGGRFYFSALPAEQDAQSARHYELDPDSGAVTELAELPESGTQANPSALPAAQVAHLGAMDEQQYVYTLGETEYRAVLRMDMDVGAAVITFLVDGEAVSLLEVESIYAFYDEQEVQAAGEEAFILARQAEDGVFYAAYVERLQLSFAGGRALIYESSADGISAGPERLICAVPLAGT